MNSYTCVDRCDEDGEDVAEDGEVVLDERHFYFYAVVLTETTAIELGNSSHFLFQFELFNHFINSVLL